MRDDQGHDGRGAGRLARYAPGSHWLVVAGRALLLLPESTELGFVQECWSTARDGAGIVELTSVLAREGFGRFGDVVVAVIDADAVRVVLRGAASVQQGGILHDAQGRATWAEQTLALEAVTASLGERAENPEIPLMNGVARVSMVAWEIAPSSDPQPGGMRDAAEAVGRHRVPDEDGTPAQSGEATARPETLREVLSPANLAAPDIVERGGLDAPVADPAHGGHDPAESADAHGETLRDEELKAVVADAESAAPDLPDAPEAMSDGDLPIAVDGLGEDSYDRLFGATAYVAKPPPNVGSAPPIEPRPAAPTEPQSGSVPESLTPDAPPTPAAAASVENPLRQPMAEAESHSSRPTAPLIASVPDWGPPAPSEVLGKQPSGTPTPLPTPEITTVSPDVDDAGLTISRAELQARRAAGPSIHGVRCPSGHPNPPEATVCRSCRLEIPLQATTTMPRPPLGALVLEGIFDGAPASIALDGAFILGRRPSVDRVTDTVPRLVTLPSPEQDLSRNHIRVNVEGWHVLVTDLGSKNGTMIVAPDEPPQRLHPDRPAMITPGTRVVLAEVVTYRYEATS